MKSLSFVLILLAGASSSATVLFAGDRDNGTPASTAAEVSDKAASSTAAEQVEQEKLKALRVQVDSRQALQADIAARYSKSEDGKLTPEDRRRYARDLFIEKNDLNGDGKVDQHELKAMVERAKKQKQEKPSEKTTPSVPAQKGDRNS